jgi:hypothetical protein
MIIKHLSKVKVDLFYINCKKKIIFEPDEGLKEKPNLEDNPFPLLPFIFKETNHR